MFDDLKRHDGRTHTGMRVGGRHEWRYPEGVWTEQKTAAEAWDFAFRSTRQRMRAAPVGSGAGVGTEYPWYLLAHQYVRKVDANTYETSMEGVKRKIAHKRLHWRAWGCEYADQEPEPARLVRILHEALDALQGPAPRGSDAPAPVAHEGRRG